MIGMYVQFLGDATISFIDDECALPSECSTTVVGSSSLTLTLTLTMRRPRTD